MAGLWCLIRADAGYRGLTSIFARALPLPSMTATYAVTVSRPLYSELFEMFGFDVNFGHTPKQG